MHRRDILTATAIAGLVAVTPHLRADPAKPEPPRRPARPDARQALLDSLVACITKSTVCLAHCEAQLAAGHKEFARCASATTDMIAIANVVQSVVTRKTAMARRATELCAASCQECASACAEHKAHFAHGMHVECKECLDACEACATACAAFLAANP